MEAGVKPRIVRFDWVAIACTRRRRSATSCSSGSSFRQFRELRLASGQFLAELGQALRGGEPRLDFTLQLANLRALGDELDSAGAA
jgi:hypothetical protein